MAMDLNSPDFDAESYVQDLLRRKGLEDLVAVEQDMVNNVRRLDSEMQSLVYENYSKFLNATSTVREMQSRLEGTHNEMRDLSSRMGRITGLSDSLTEKFTRNCETIRKLNAARDSVKKLEFLIKVPQIIEDFVEKCEYGKAVDTYIKVKPKLEEFGHIQSMKGIAKDSENIIEKLKEKLYETLNGRLISSEETIEAVTLLKQLGVHERELESSLLSCWGDEINSELNQLAENSSPDSGRYQDIFEFVDVGCCHFLTNLSLMATTFLHLFSKQASRAELIHLLEPTMSNFERIIDKRFAADQNSADCALFVKALDRIYRKISVLSRLSSGIMKEYDNKTMLITINSKYFL